MFESRAIARLETVLDNNGKHLLNAVMELSRQLDLPGVMATVCIWARELTGADGTAFILKDGDWVHYADENAIAPLWKGRRLPSTICISGWAMRHNTPVVVPDIDTDTRVPSGFYRPTFVRSLTIMPISQLAPMGAIGVYWAKPHQATERELALLQAIADATSTAMTNVYLIEQLQEAVRMRDDFLRVASHELKTPVTALSLQVFSLNRHLRRELSADTVQRVTGIEHSIGRLTLLIDQLLEAGAALTGDLQPMLDRIDLRDTISTVIGRLEDLIVRSGSAFYVDAPAPVAGTWDRGLMQTAVSNLVMNAIKYGAGKPIHIGLRADPQATTLTIRDGGIGIAVADQEKIFERFRRAVPVDNYGGFGLGLWLVRAIVEAHGGTITVDSEPGAGATFVVRLPMLHG